MATITKFHRNMMGTTSFDMQVKGMRKPQDFIVYPLHEGTNTKVISIQSEHRWGYIDVTTGKGTLSKNYNQYANSMKYAIDKVKGELTEFQLNELDLQALKMQIFVSANKKAGEDENGIVFSDNSGAINILDF